MWKEAKRARKKDVRQPITSLPKYNNNKQNMVIFYKKWKKYNEIQLTKNKMDLNIRKMTTHPPSPAQFLLSKI